MATIYASPNGNDISGNGAIDNPYKTIAKSFTALHAGDTLVLLPGIYNETDLTLNVLNTSANAPIVIKSSYDLGAIIRGWNSSTNIILRITCQYVTIQGVEFYGDSTTRLGIYPNVSHITVNRCYFHDILMYSSIFGGASVTTSNGIVDFNFTNNIIENMFIGGETLQNCHGVYVNAIGAIVSNNIFYNCRSGWGIHCYHTAQNVQVLNNLIIGASSGGLLFGNDAGSTIDGCITANNIMLDCATSFTNGAIREIKGAPSGDIGTNMYYNKNLSYGIGLNTSPSMTNSLNTMYSFDPLVIRGKDSNPFFRYVLRHSSDCYSLGDTTNKTTSDINGIPRLTNDIGPFSNPHPYYANAGYGWDDLTEMCLNGYDLGLYRVLVGLYADGCTPKDIVDYTIFDGRIHVEYRKDNTYSNIIANLE